jgi:hypothetical protein
MKMLMVATKSPWPAVDGGRLLLLQTLEALATVGVRPTLVAPLPAGSSEAEILRQLRPLCEARLVPVQPAGALRGAMRALRSGTPFSIARHSVPEVVVAVRAAIAQDGIELLHAEQLQAFSNAERASGGGLPTVLRTQNVESDLWRAAARSPLLRLEARRLARWEGRAIGRATLPLALTSDDRSRLMALAEAAGRQAEVLVCAPPFPAELPSGPSSLPGDPAITLMGSASWYPNQESTRWFVQTVWPAVRTALPGAVLHVFGDLAGSDRQGVSHHASPANSAMAFAPNGILVVPLRIGSGVRMKILEAWARRVPVVATPEAVAGLDAVDGREVLVARDPAEFVTAFQRLQADPGLRTSLIGGGIAALRQRHDPERVGRALVHMYERAQELWNERKRE